MDRLEEIRAEYLGFILGQAMPLGPPPTMEVKTEHLGWLITQLEASQEKAKRLERSLEHAEIEGMRLKRKSLQAEAINAKLREAMEWIQAFVRNPDNRRAMTLHQARRRMDWINDVTKKALEVSNV
jgi:t-SNARE complex subunit (syntaxin)